MQLAIDHLSYFNWLALLMLYFAASGPVDHHGT